MADRYQYQQLAFVDFSIPVEVVTIDKWFVNIVQPIVSERNHNYATTFVSEFPSGAIVTVGGIPSLALTGVGF